jgi:hypothetical protein
MGHQELRTDSFARMCNSAATRPSDRAGTDCYEVTAVETMAHCDPSGEPDNVPGAVPCAIEHFNC